MIREDDILDDVFRSQLGHFEQKPPVNIWNRVQHELRARKRRRMVAIGRWLSVAAVVLLAFLLGGKLQSTKELHHVENTQETIAARHSSVAGQLKENSVRGEKGNKRSSPGQFRRLTEEQRFVPVYTRKKNNIHSLARIQQLKHIIVDAPSSTVKPLKRLSSRQGRLVQELADVKTLKEPMSSSFLTEQDRVIFEQNLKFRKTNKKRLLADGSWKVGVRVSPDYSVNRNSYSDDYARQLPSGGSSDHLSLGGGLVTEFKTSGRWSLQAGVNYTRLAQNSGSNSSESSNYLLDVSPESFSASESSFAAHIAADGTMLLNGAAGVIQLQNVPRGTIVTSSFEKMASSSTVVFSQSDIEQVFDYLEVPVSVRYQVFEGTIGMQVLVGINSGMLIGNKAYLDNRDNSRTMVGKTRDMRTFSYSSQLGMALNVEVTPSWQINLEPRLRYYLQSLNQSSEVSFQPYLFSITTGVSYKF